MVQRFGSDLALNVLFHALFLDGVYDAHSRFTPIAAPSREQMHALSAACRSSATAASATRRRSRAS